MPRVNIYITLKPTLLDSQGRVLENALKSLGYEGINQVRVGKLIEVDINDNGNVEQTVKEMCDKLLANPVIENYRVEVIK